MPSRAKAIVTVPAKILLVDGHRAGLKARCMVLEEAGYHVTGASLPEDALQLLRQETYNLVVTEYKFGTATCTDIIDRIREAAGTIPVILLSGLVEPLGLTERSTGADAVLMKSASEPKQLTLAVNRLLRVRRAPRATSVKKPAASAKPAPEKPLVRRAGASG